YCFERSCCQPAVAYFGGYGPLWLCLIEHIAVCLAIRIDQSPPFRLGKRQFPDFRIVVDDNEVTGRYLLGGDEIRNGIHKETLDRALQVPSAVLKVDAFIE